MFICMKLSPKTAMMKRNNESVYKEWNRMRNNAIGPSDLAEIDAIFTRHLNEKELA